MKPITPWPQFLFADPLRIVDEHLSKSDVLVDYGFDFDFLTEGHSLARKSHPAQGVSAEDPHSRLRIIDPSQEQNRHDQRQYPIADLMLEAHRRTRQHRKTRGRKKAYSAMEKRFQKITQCVDGVGMVPVQRHYDIPSCA